MKISVVVPVYNGEKYIDTWWKGIKSQTIDKRYFEVILVDNNSTDGTMEKLGKIDRENKKIDLKILKYTEKASSYGSRNLGIDCAKGDIVAFTDIDCIVHKNWLKEIKERLSKETCLIIGGRVEMIVEDRGNIWEEFDKQVYLSNERYVEEDKVATANMATKKEVFSKVGKFLEVTSGEDHQWSMRAGRLGMKIEYLKDTVVYHPTRKTYEETKEKMYRVGYGRGQRSGRGYKKQCLIHLLRVFHLPRSIHLAMGMKECSGKKKIGFILKMIVLRYWQLLGFIEGGHESRCKR